MPKKMKDLGSNAVRCPWCHRPQQRFNDRSHQYWCAHCQRLFDAEPDEGGDYSARNPAARMEREERRSGRT